MSGPDARKTIPGLSAEEERAAAEPARPAEDTGSKEAALFARGLSEDEVKALARESEHTRSERFRDEFERIAIWGLRLAAAVLGVAVLVWLLHLLMPDRWRWLSPDEASKLQALVTGGIIGTVVGHLKKRLGG